MEVKPGYKLTEVGVIPEEWNCVKLGEAAASVQNAIVGGPFGSDLTSAHYVDQGVPVIRGVNMAADFVGGPFVFVSPDKARSLSANLARPGDLVFTQRGTLGQVSLVPNDDYSTYLLSQSQMKITMARRRYEPEFIRQFFASPTGQKQILASAIQTGIPHTNLTILRSYRIPAPPLEEQQSIASALREMDSLLARLDRLIAKKRDLKQAAMQPLLTGQTRLPGFHGEWEVKRLGDHVDFLRHGVFARASLVEHGTVRYLHYGDIHGAANVVLSPAQTDMPYLPSALARTLDRLTTGDLIFADASEDLAGVGKSVEIDNSADVEVVAGLHTIAARFDKSVLADGFKAYLQHIPAFRQHLLRLAAGTKVLATNRAHVASLELTLPGIDEQSAIANVLSDMDAELSALEARREKTRALKEAMMQELLTGRTRLV